MLTGTVDQLISDHIRGGCDLDYVRGGSLAVAGARQRWLRVMGSRDRKPNAATPEVSGQDLMLLAVQDTGRTPRREWSRSL